MHYDTANIAGIRVRLLGARRARRGGTKRDRAIGENVVQYLGGKWAARNRIAAHVLSHGLPVFEPFVGGANLPHLWPKGSLCADIDAGLIALYRKVQAEGVDWIPDACTREDYAESMARTDERPIDTFRLVACSFRGKKKGGYSRDTPGRTNHARQGRNSLRRLIGLDVQFHALDFLTLAPFGGVTLYCDPPYEGTTGYKSGAFDHDRFRARLREWARFGPVYVTEYAAQPGWIECDIAHSKPGATLAKKHDRLFLVRRASLHAMGPP